MRLWSDLDLAPTTTVWTEESVDHAVAAAAEGQGPLQRVASLSSFKVDYCSRCHPLGLYLRLLMRKVMNKVMDLVAGWGARKSFKECDDQILF